MRHNFFFFFFALLGWISSTFVVAEDTLPSEPVFKKEKDSTQKEQKSTKKPIFEKKKTEPVNKKANKKVNKKANQIIEQANQSLQGLPSSPKKTSQKIIRPPIIPPPILPSATDKPTVSSAGSIGGGIGFEYLDQDWFLNLRIAFEYSVGAFGFGVDIPLRFRVKDNIPLTEGGDFAGLRKEDWDEWTDFFRILRFVRLGTKNNPFQVRVKEVPLAFYLRLGELKSASLGHGSIMYHYFNNLLPDHYRTGLEFDFHTPYGGFEFVMNHVFSPNVIGGRIYLRPVAMFAPDSWWTRLSVASTVVVDPRAPFVLKDQLSTATHYQTADEMVKGFNTLVAYGFDIDLALLRLSWISLSPYMDLNVLNGGVGYHLGLLTLFRIPNKTLSPFEIHTRFEYRVLGKGYVAQYFDALYDFQRYGMRVFQTQVPQNVMNTQPKMKAVQENRQELLHGFYGELSFRLGAWLTIGATFDEYQGPNNGNLQLFVTIPALKFVQFGASFIKRGFDGAGEIFVLDDRSYLTAEVKVPFLGFLFVQAFYQRTWVPQSEGNSLNFRAVDNFSFYVGAQYSF